MPRPEPGGRREPAQISAPEPNDYRDIAPIYDTAIDQSTYFLSFLARLMKKKRARVLDLGCGTGKYSIPLAEKGFTVTGLDYSKEMLAVAKRKAAGKKLEIEFVRERIESFRAAEEFDFVVSCDCFNHFCEDEKLKKAFRTAAESLKEGGRFFFQFYAERYFRAMAGEAPYAGRMGENFFIWENFYERGIFEIVFSSFISKGGEIYKRNEGIVWEKAHSRKWIEKELKKAGFRKIKEYGRTMGRPAKRPEEYYFAAEK